MGVCILAERNLRTESQNELALTPTTHEITGEAATDKNEAVAITPPSSGGEGAREAILRRP
jgi:hypothetical protein